jgi:hypothetical protein
MPNTFFDQRGQHVQYQYNAAGDIHIGSATAKQDLVPQLQKLLEEIAKARAANAIDDEAAIDASSSMEKAIVQAKKPAPEGSTIVKHLQTACGILQGVTTTSAAVVSLVGGLKEAVAVVARLFP